MQASARRSSPESCEPAACRGPLPLLASFLTYFPDARDPLQCKRARTWARGSRQYPSAPTTANVPGTKRGVDLSHAQRSAPPPATGAHPREEPPLPSPAGRWGLRAAAVLAFAIALTAVGMFATYSLVRVLES